MYVTCISSQGLTAASGLLSIRKGDHAAKTNKLQARYLKPTISSKN
ncbi:MAG: hypothetical protein HWD62_00925 [Cyclobacteriaceae bacterium]|nr:MAG: hypothetical protein HWD62_00925 [Cyclobacteriaceae bacterium]